MSYVDSPPGSSRYQYTLLRPTRSDQFRHRMHCSLQQHRNCSPICDTRLSHLYRPSDRHKPSPIQSHGKPPHDLRCGRYRPLVEDCRLKINYIMISCDGAMPILYRITGPFLRRIHILSMESTHMVPVIWGFDVLMWLSRTNYWINNNFSVIWDTMVLIRGHCNASAMLQLIFFRQYCGWISFVHTAPLARPAA